jgi:hypothetical protein
MAHLRVKSDNDNPHTTKVLLPSVTQRDARVKRLLHVQAVKDKKMGFLKTYWCEYCTR